MRSAAVTWPLSRPSEAGAESDSRGSERESLAQQRLESFVAGLAFTRAGAAPALDAAAAELFDVFAAARIDALLLKGAALERMLYEPDERRQYLDIDVLVRPDHAARVAELLSERGYRNITAGLGIDDVGGVVHADTWVSPAGVPAHEIDLHRWLPGARAPHERAWDALWRRHTTIDLAGSQVPVLMREGQALHLSIHAAQHGPSYGRGIWELRRALERWRLDVWRAAAELASEIDAVGLFAAGLRLAPEGVERATELGLPVDDELDWEIAHRLDRPRGTFHVEALGSAPGLRGRLGLLRKALLPGRRWLEIEFHWAKRGPVRLALAYVLHLARAPVWAARAWLFRRRAGSAAARSDGPGRQP